MIVVFWVLENDGIKELGRVILDEGSLRYPPHLAESLGTLLQKVDLGFDLVQASTYDYYGVDVREMSEALSLAPWVFAGSRVRAELYAHEEDIPDHPLALPPEPPRALR